MTNRKAGWRGLALLLCLLMAPGITTAVADETQISPAPAPAPGPGGAEAAEGKAALEKGDRPTAAAAYRKALELAPDNKDYLHNAAVLTAATGQTDPAFALLTKATLRAVADHNQADAALYGETIVKLRSAAPPWVDEKMAAAAAVPVAKQRALAIWSGSMGRIAPLMAAKDYPKALQTAQQTLGIARDNLGENHVATMISTSYLANIHQQAGQLDKAETTYRQAIDLGTKILGPDHPETIKLQTALAAVYDALLRFSGAEALYQSSADAYGRGIGADHADALANQITLGRNIQNQGRFEDADNILSTTCGRYRTLFGLLHADTARCLTQLASVKSQRGDFKTAESLYNEALTTERAVLPENDGVTLTARLDLGRIYLKQGHYTEARDQLAAVVKDAGAAHPGPQAMAKSILATAYDELGDYKIAQTLLSEALAYQTTAYGAGHPYTVTTLNNLASLYRRQGQLAEAETTFRKALDLFKKTLGDNHPTTVVAANNLGEILEREGLYDQAEPWLRTAYEGGRLAFGEWNPVTMDALNNLALLMESQGNFDKAEPLYRTVIDHFTEQLGVNHPDTIAVTNNLAYLYLLQQNYAKAEPLFQNVYAAWRKTIGDTNQNTLKGLNNLARVTHYQGRYPEAEKLFRRAIDARRKTLGERHIDTLRSMHDLGVLYHSTKKLREADKLLTKTLALDEDVLGPKHPYTFETINSLAAVKEDLKDLPGALKLREQGFQRRTEFLNQMLWVTGENAREGYIRLHAPELDTYLTLLAQIDPAEAGRRLIDVSLQRKGLLLRISSEIQQTTRLSGNANTSMLVAELNSIRKQLASMTLAGPTSETKDSYLQTIAKLEDRTSVVEGLIGRESVRFKECASRISTNQLVESLPEGTALVDFYIYKDKGTSHLLAATLRKQDGKPVFGLIKYTDLAVIDKAVLDYRAVIQKEDVEDSELATAGKAIYELLWAPVQPHIGTAKSVTVIPDGVLNILPINAMVVPSSGKFMIETLDLHILNSSRDVIPTRIPPAGGKFLINAGPDYNSDQGIGKEALEKAQGRRSAEINQGLRGMGSGMRGLHFDPLPGAEKEGQLILKAATSKGLVPIIYNKQEAQEKTLKDQTEAPEILHIATHGFFLKPDDSLKKRLLKLQRGADIHIPPPGDNPLLRSGLAFAGINANAQYLGEIDTENDGVLTALEVLGLNLEGTKLAILSACETGLGEIHEGEGVYGLRRAFQEAGVRSVVSSLWEVSDAGTQALMTALYGRLVGGASPHEALRDSQLEMLNSGQWKMPYIWSAFMMVERS